MAHSTHGASDSRICRTHGLSRYSRSSPPVSANMPPRRGRGALRRSSTPPCAALLVEHFPEPSVPMKAACGCSTKSAHASSSPASTTVAPNAANFVGHYPPAAQRGDDQHGRLPPSNRSAKTRSTRTSGTTRSSTTNSRLRTCAMLAVPLYFAGELRGVISAVQLRLAGFAGAGAAGFHSATPPRPCNWRALHPRAP